MSIATRTGDDGQTGLVYNRRVPKTEPAVEVYGTVDELNAALGMARASSSMQMVKDKLVAIQKQLIPLMGELAVAPEDIAQYREDAKHAKLTPDMLTQLDQLVKEIESKPIKFDGWATPGASIASAALDVARTVCRRAERLVVRQNDSGAVKYPLTIKYLNRLSDVLWLLARYTETFQDNV